MKKESLDFINFSTDIIKDGRNGNIKSLSSSDAYDMLRLYFDKVTYGPNTNWKEIPDEIQCKVKADQTNKGSYYYEPPLEKKLSLNDLRNVVYSFIEISKSEKICQTVNTSDKPLVVIGDIHGNETLVKNFLIQYDIRNYNYLFLGDYIDRGSSSLACIILVYLIKIFNPVNVLLRGNHELNLGFCDLERDLISHYKEINSMDDIMNLSTLIRYSFDYLSLCAIVDNKYYCVHGGIPKEWEIIRFVFDEPKPFKLYLDPEDYGNALEKDEDQHLFLQFLWNDVNERKLGFLYNSSEVNEFCPNDNRGNVFYLYPLVAVDKFLQQNNFVKIIRGHLPIPEGIREVGNVITVHSTTYTYNSRGGFLIIFKGEIKKNII